MPPGEADGDVDEQAAEADHSADDPPGFGVVVASAEDDRGRARAVVGKRAAVGVGEEQTEGEQGW